MKIYKIANRNIVSFDFDETIFLLEFDEKLGEYKFDFNDRHLGKINQDIIKIMRDHISKGDKVICVTSRSSTWRENVEYEIKKNNVPIDISEIYFTNGQLKAETLEALGVSIHYDDKPEEISAAKSVGIEGIQV